MFPNTLKDNLLALKTFLNYKVDDFIGYKIIDQKSGTLVNELWWKVFAKFKSQIQASTTIKKRNIKTSAQVFINGTNLVTKVHICKAKSSTVLYYYLMLIKLKMLMLYEVDVAIRFSILSRMSGFLRHSSKWV